MSYEIPSNLPFLKLLATFYDPHFHGLLATPPGALLPVSWYCRPHEGLQLPVYMQHHFLYGHLGDSLSSPESALLWEACLTLQ